MRGRLVCSPPIIVRNSHAINFILVDNPSRCLEEPANAPLPASTPLVTVMCPSTFPSPLSHMWTKKLVKNSSKNNRKKLNIPNTWKRLTYLIAFPAIALTAIPVVNIEMHHAEHRKHLRELPDEEWPTQYEYQNLRQKKFFWGDGDKTLFWNSDINRHIES